MAVIGVALAFAAQAIGSSPPEPEGAGTCLEFAQDVDPKQVPVDSGYDPERDVVYAHHGGRTYVLRPSDPTCRALTSVRAVMDDAVATDRENETRSCREVSDALTAGRTQVRGRGFDREAAQRYLAERCGSAG